MPGATVISEASADLLARLAGGPGRVRLLGSEPALAALEPAVHVDGRPPVLLGRIELLRYVREQAVSRTLHRYGNVVRPFDERCRPDDPDTTSPADVLLDDTDDRWLAPVDRRGR
jgi:hypothetical protein